MSLLNDLKGKGVSIAAKSFLQKYVEDYGKIMDLDIDPNTHEIRCSLQLYGESETVVVIIRGIKSFKEDDKYYVRFHSFEISRRWINTLAQKYLPQVVKDNRVEVPEMVGKALIGLKLV